jgi:ABC-2 type transport system permease protein
MVSEHFLASFRLYFRNRMGMFYGYLFPVIFLVAFRVLYRSEPTPMTRHMGQLLTVTILGSTCLGMPTTMVSERERGVWRRYRLAPVAMSALVSSAVGVRFFLSVTAGLLQLLLAMAIGMPLPKHPLDLCVAFTFVSFAFLGLGLVLAAMADNVPSVQALGQCIFLPMLIIGGVAVPLDSLPVWAQRVADFFPGRYAVESLQACFTGPGISSSGFDFVALVLIGASGFFAGAKMFRWDAQQRFAARGKVWLVTVLAAWGLIGVMAEAGIRNHKTPPQPSQAALPAAIVPAPQVVPPVVSNTPKPVAPTGEVKPQATPPHQSTVWQDVTVEEINQNTDFRLLPSDDDVVAPIARKDVAPPPDIADQLNTLKMALPDWAPGNAADPVQRVRNLLFVAAVPDVSRAEILESYVPQIVFDQLEKDFPRDELIKLLFWVAVHPSSGDASAATQVDQLGLENFTGDTDTLRERVSVYGLKLVGRLIGKIPVR